MMMIAYLVMWGDISVSNSDVLMDDDTPAALVSSESVHTQDIQFVFQCVETKKSTFFENVPASKEVLAFLNSCKPGNFSLYQYEEYESQRILLLNTTLVGEQAIGSLGRFPGKQQDQSEEGVLAIMTPAQFRCVSAEWLKNNQTDKFTWYKDNKFQSAPRIVRVGCEYYATQKDRLGGSTWNRENILL